MPSENYDFVPWDSPDDIEKFLGAALQGARALGGKVLGAGAKLNTKRLALRSKIGEKIVPAAKNLITGKKEGPLASSPASEAVESMPSTPAPEMPEPEMPETPSGPDPNIALGRGEASGFTPKKKQNQAMQFAQQSLASSQQRKQAQEQRAIEMARRGSEVGKAPMDMAWRLLKKNDDEKRRDKLNVMEQLEEPIPSKFISGIKYPQSTLPIPLPNDRRLISVIHDRPDMKVDRRNLTFARHIPHQRARRDFLRGYKDRMRFKEGRPTPTKVEVIGGPEDGYHFVLTDDDGRAYSTLGARVEHEDSIENIPNTTHTISNISARTPEEQRRRGYYGSLFDTLLQNKIGVISNNRNTEFSQPFHEKFQQQLPTNIIAGGGEFARSKDMREAANRVVNEYRYGHSPEFEQGYLDVAYDTTGWGDLKPMFGNQYPMFGSIDKPIKETTENFPAGLTMRVQDNSDPSTPKIREFRQARIGEYLGKDPDEVERYRNTLDFNDLASMLYM